MTALHVAGLLAFVANTVQQNPVVVGWQQNSAPVQVQVLGGSSWDKWGPSILQTAISLASIAAAVVIAVISFRRNRRLEQEQWERNQKATHDQWIRDQKKAEWSQLLQKIAAIDNKISESDFQNIEANEIWHTLERVKPALMSTLFIHQALETSNFIKRWEDFCEYARKTYVPSQIWSLSLESVPTGKFEINEAADHAKSRAMFEKNELVKMLDELRIAFRQLAIDDLGSAD